MNLPRHRRSRDTLVRYEVGEAVMAHYTPARLGWFSGRISAVDSIKGLYDVQYDDGDFDRHVTPDRLRKRFDDADDFDDTDDGDEEEEKEVKRYATENKQICNGAIVAACQKYLSGKTFQGLVIDARMLNTSNCLVGGNFLQNQADVLTIINKGKDELIHMVGSMHELQKKCQGALSIESGKSGDILTKIGHRGEKLNMIFLDYTQTLKTNKGDLEKLFREGNIWEDDVGVFGITLSKRGNEEWDVQAGIIESYLKSVTEGKYVLTEEFRHPPKEEKKHIYGQMIFFCFKVNKVVNV